MSDFTIIKNKNFIGHGYEFPGGKVVIQWHGDINSLVIYEKLEDVEKLHGKVKFSCEQLNGKLTSPSDSPKRPPQHLQSCPEPFVKLSP